MSQPQVPVTDADLAVVRAQLGREPRGLVGVAHRCPCGLPDVVTTAPRLPDGTPFPTTFYLTCPRLAAAVGSLEGVGVMRAMEQRLHEDPRLAERYAAAHEDYLARRASLGEPVEIRGISAGGMPDRVKCLHALVAHSLVAGPGVNPFGDEALTMLAGTSRSDACVVPAVEDVRVAAVDCGTNAIKLLVADLTPGSRTLSEVERRMEIVRLGEDVDRTGNLDPAALARTLLVLDRYAERIDALGAQRVCFVATSAARDAANVEALATGVRHRLRVEPQIIPGEEEARLTFVGAMTSLPRVSTPTLVLDIGGGSTEFVVGGPGPAPGPDSSPISGSAPGPILGPTAASSIDVGCVRLSERHFRHDPPLPSEVRAARDEIDAGIRRAARSVPLRQRQRLVGVAGTVTTLAAIARELPSYDPARIHAARVDAAEVHQVAERLLYLPREQRAAIPVLHPGRVDVIAAGALILSAVVAFTGAPSLVASEHDILDGLAWGLLDAEPPNSPA